MDEDDATLVARICEGSDRAFNLLIDRHQQAVRAFLRRLGLNPSEADDIAQDTFVAAWEGARQYRRDASVRSWLCAIAWRKAKAAQRSWFRNRSRETNYDAELAQDRGSGSISEDRIAMMQALSALPIEQRATISLCLIEGFSHAEAAAALKVPLGTVKSHVTRGRNRLLGVLREIPEEEK